jgi:imidazolonepropionase-like amidohydrolase
MNLFIRNVRLIDGTGASPTPSTNIAVEDGAIGWIGEGGYTSENKHGHYEEINGEDLTLLPGLFDCHEHFTGDGGRNGVANMHQDSFNREVLLVKGAANARRALLAGQTSARDVGSPFGVSITLARAVATRNLPGPRITASGQWIQFPTTWSRQVAPPVTSIEQLKEVILEQISQGAGLIKLGATGVKEDGTGYGTLGIEAARVAVELAHQHGLKVAAHCWYAKRESVAGVFDGARQVVEAGVDSIEHGTHIDDDTAKLMARKGTFLVPTLSTWDYPLRAAKRWSLPKDQVEMYEAQRDSSIASVKRCLSAEVRIAAGTDAGGAPVRHGMVVREMELLMQVGLKPLQAVESATRLAAELTGTLNQVGTIQVGKLADFLLVDGDPLTDFITLRNPWAIFQGGVRIKY